ncbi:hypothetical protein MTZ49_02845 [Entomomonas sp. E2T0]|uniref:hypothetical protein n=1 Tax=Entomomonas sp. E2T0 TaxID=2930213 RepID=UPI002228290A|nr:hypothetical protein [Entomomonas sp. E2T0]UYZ84521.1 hypothetical protein MTZ49_02845 [Entomomonas sp. E2T0]
MKNITQTIATLFLGFILTIPTIVFAQNINDKTLYKWQDTTGKWHYSKIPPDQTLNYSPNKIEVAKDTRTLIFAEKKEETTSQEKQETIVESKLRQQRISCQTTPSTMMNTALYLHRIVDKNFQEKSITQEEYEQKKQTINKLEEIASDLNFYDYCMDDFSRKPHIKAVSDCMTKEDSMEKRTSCLKELPPM